MERAFVLLTLAVACADDSVAPADTRIPCTHRSQCDDANVCTEDLCVRGFCESTAYDNGYICDDGNLCTELDICVEAVCAGTPKNCEVQSDFCNVARCDLGTGECVRDRVDDGTLCDDGQVCTVDDACAAGDCVGAARDCSSFDGPCSTGDCAEDIEGGCFARPSSELQPCDDGSDCTGPVDVCRGGVCTGPYACNDNDACTFDLCNEMTRQCENEPLGLQPGAEGPSVSPTCSDLLDNDCDGAVDGDDVSCIVCVGDPDCDDGNPCTTDGCFGTSCSNTPVVCNDNDACTSSYCDPAGGACNHDPVQLDPLSPVFVSGGGSAPLGGCLVAGTRARLVVWTELRDTHGEPVANAAEVRIGGVAATPSTAAPGTYYREITAPAATGSELLSVTANACGDQVTLLATVPLTYAEANSGTGGTGGCSPAGGNLRVRVVEAESGRPISGAHVLLADASGPRLEHAVEAIFGGPPEVALNRATTDALGHAELFDYGGALSRPFTVTAGADDRAYFTIVRGNASDVVLALPLLHAPRPPSTTYTGAATVPFTNCSDLDAGFVLPKLRLDQLSSFELSALLGKSRCWDSGNQLVGHLAIPENLWIPAQGLGPECFIPGSVNEARWSVALNNGRTENLQLLMAQATIQDLLQAFSNNDLSGILSVIGYRRVSFLLEEAVPTPPTERSFAASDDYPFTTTVLYAGAPPDTDVLGITAADYTGGNGTGDVFMLATGLHRHDEGGSSVVVRNSDLTAPGMPPGARRLISVAAMYLEPDDHPNVPDNRIMAISTVLLRDDGDGNAPFGGDANATLTVNDFLGHAATTYTPGDGRFAWTNTVANGNAPLYSMHELRVRTLDHLPVLPCSNSNELRWHFSTQWIVMKPFRPDCAGQECFSLPELPNDFPRWGTEPRKKSGFERIVGSGLPCSGSCTTPGERCVDPDGAGPLGQRCMGGQGTDAEPYYSQSYRWGLHLYDLELYPGGFDFNRFELSDRARYMTHESSNQEIFY